jgi:hypothetical protein
MKKSILIAAILLFGLYTNVIAGVSPGCYVKSDDKIYFGQKLRFGLTTVRVLSDNGSIVKVPIKEVDSYKQGNRYFELRPTVNSNFETEGNAMMELLKTKGDLKLYRCLKKDVGAPVYDYYVFKKERFHLLLDKDNAATVLSFFGIEVKFE